MKLLVLTLAVLVLAQSTEGGWFRTAINSVARALRHPVVRTTTRIISYIPGLRIFRYLGKRDDGEVILDGPATREQVAEILDLDDEEVEMFFTDYDEDGDDLIDEAEFAVFYEEFSILESLSSE
ncbi:hypothetical protein SNE40_005209 [Patella caerulea]|uniref:EF-hand domain-containing protein n=1 Tax=Patella caerulea TaxID=87958 RepID=A0AAN8K0W2_PATCE